MEKDPVCGMEVQPKANTPRAEYEGRTYYFCAESCRQRFQQDPKRYVGVQQDRAR